MQSNVHVTVVPSSKPSKGIVIAENVTHHDMNLSKKVVVVMGGSESVNTVGKAPMQVGAKEKGKGKLFIACPMVEASSDYEESGRMVSDFPPSLEAKEWSEKTLFDPVQGDGDWGILL